MSTEHSPIPAQHRQTIARLAQGRGFDMLGVAQAKPSEHGQFLKQWLADGHHGEMAYLSNQLQERLDPNSLVPDAKSILCFADRYPSTHTPPEASEGTNGGDQVIADKQIAAAHGRIARFAWRRDYHRDLKKRLHQLADDLREKWPQHTFRTTVDTAPVLEKGYAANAGLGWIGKNTLVIHPEKGSYFILGEIITTLPVQTQVESGQSIVTDHCGSCTRCIDACPTQCITPYSVDASRCTSYLTIEHRSAIAPDLQQAIGPWIAGCDICQEVCPYNRPPRKFSLGNLSFGGNLSNQDENEFDREPAITSHTSLPLLDIMNWTPEARQAALQGSALKRIKLAQFKRNALIAAGHVVRNEPDHPQAAILRQRIQELATDTTEDELVRQTAGEVIQWMDLSSRDDFC